MSLLAQDPRATRLPLLSRILIGYGIVGLVGAVMAALLLLLAFGRVSALSDQLSGQVGGVSAVLNKTAAALEDAGTTAGSFATTIDTGSAAMTKAAADLRQVIPQLRDLETRANEVTILGAQPLGRIAELFGQIADNVTDVTTQIDNVSKSLVGNRSALEANARSLSALADQVRTLSGTFASDQLAAAIDSIRWLILALLVIAAIGAAVPAGGALVTGWWLRGWLRAGGTAPPAPVSPFSA
jgi:methyl-accepting chemotaxis protein